METCSVIGSVLHPGSYSTGARFGIPSRRFYLANCAKYIRVAYGTFIFSGKLARYFVISAMIRSNTASLPA